MYKRQAITMGAEKQCYWTNNSEVQERRNDLNDGKKTEDRSVATVERTLRMSD